MPGWRTGLRIVAVSLALTVAAYDVLVRRTRVTRFLFGLREGGRPEHGLREAGRDDRP
ncbi:MULTISPECIES: hypothetical protein [Streptomyces]|uniref:hypothetical protein n=1 Tax=Streptomyces TaxID=1883 RepID=UPI00142D33EE|nr:MULTISPECIES: hypothetical protein [Streptomyces]